MDEKKKSLEIPAHAVGPAGGDKAAAPNAEPIAPAAPAAPPPPPMMQGGYGGGLSMQTPSEDAAGAEGQAADATPAAIEAAIIAHLRTVYDPEIPVNIYDLGLIYDISVQESGDVAIKMTVTAPGCPVAGEMPGMVELATRRVEAVAACDVELVWDPPWNPDMMTEDAKLTLNI